jgi:hypothetical protein
MIFHEIAYLNAPGLRPKSGGGPGCERDRTATDCFSFKKDTVPDQPPREDR